MIPLQEILTLTIEETGIEKPSLVGRDRYKNLVFARGMFAVAARKLSYSYPDIGKALGGRDHTTIINLFNKFRENTKVIEFAEKVGERAKGYDEKKFVGVNENSPPNKKWLNVYKMYGHQCYVCGFDEVTEVHHIIPRSAGGTNSMDNLVLLCPNHHALADRGMIEIKLININGRRFEGVYPLENAT